MDPVVTGPVKPHPSLLPQPMRPDAKEMSEADICNVSAYQREERWTLAQERWTIFEPVAKGGAA